MVVSSGISNAPAASSGESKCPVILSAGAKGFRAFPPQARPPFAIILLEGGANPMPVTLAAVEDARRRIAGSALRTPLVRLNCPDAPAEVYLKLENLQPIGSFKIRGAANAMARLPAEQLR